VRVDATRRAVGVLGVVGGIRRDERARLAGCGLKDPGAGGRQTASEGLGHQEFVLTYKSSEPTGPSCLPMAR